MVALGSWACSQHGMDAGAPADETELNALLHDGELSSLSILSEPGAAGSAGSRTPIDPSVTAPPAEATTDASTGEAGAGGGGASGGTGGVSVTDAGTAGAGGGRPTFDGGVAGAAGSSAAGDGGVAGSFGTGGAFATDGGRGGDFGEGGVPHFGPMDSWSFDQCNEFQTDLFSDRSGHTAFRSVATKCTEGVNGLALAFTGDKDLAYVPDQPQFTFEQGVTVAAWVNPDSLRGDQTIFRKRFTDTSSFALMLHNGQYQFVAKLTSGKAVTVAAKAKVNAWTHVAATYDGTVLRLFLDGKEVKTTKAKGTLANGEGPLLMGNDALRRRLSGKLDTVTFDTFPMSASEIAALTCVHRPETLAVTPDESGPVAPGTAFDYHISLTNNDSAACAPTFYNFFQRNFTPELQVSANPVFQQLAPGQSGPVTMSVVSQFDAEPGKTRIEFGFFGNRFNPVEGSVGYEVAPGTGCRVITGRELTIRDLSVVEDRIRTNPAVEGDGRAGAWTLAKLLEDMAPTPADASGLLEDVLNTWLTERTVNGFKVPARPGISPLVLDPFPRTPDGHLDLSRAPVRLLAIVNREDLRDLSQGKAGEGRFVFGVTTPEGFPLEFTIILEYNLPAKTEADVLKWQNDFHALGGLPFPSEEYNAALQALTDRFAGRNAAPELPNGSAMIHFRTNEIATSFVWELRQFVLSKDTGRLVQTGVPLTPDRSFNRSPLLADFVNANEAAIIAETHTVPDELGGKPFLAGTIDNPLTTWFAPGINNNEARHHLALNTCDGCHGGETNIPFLQIFPRSQGQVSSLSQFLTGGTVFDPISGQPRQFSELARRNRDLHQLVCPNDPLPPPPPPPSFDGGVEGGAGGSAGGPGGGTGGSIVGGSGGSAVPPPPRPIPVARATAPTIVQMTPEERSAFIAKGINRKD